MKASNRAEYQWRGWSAATARPEMVTSARLAASAGVSNRLFPKTRSWFALGSPLELLSPLSVLRVLYALAVVGWPAVALGAGASGRDLVRLGAATGLMAVVWVALIRVRSVAVRACQCLTGLAALGAVVAAPSGSGLERVGFAVTFVLPTAVAAGLFLRSRAVVLHTGLVTVAMWGVLFGTDGTGRSAAVVAPLGFSLLLVALCVQFLTRSARRQSTVDPDTGLPNGFGLAERAAAQPESFSTFVVAVAQLAGIDQARDALGYRIGSELLRRAVEDIGQVLPADAVIGRVEGDSLAVLLPVPGTRSGDPAAADDLIGVTEVANQLAATLSRAIQSGRYLVGEIEVYLRAHVGLALAPWDGTDVMELERCASLAARQAEAAGRARGIWSGAAGAMTIDDLAVLADLRLAASRGELTLAYQPQISAATGRTVAVEALLRWHHTTRGFISPGTFIPLAERTGLVDPLTEWVLAEALDAHGRWRTMGIDLPVSINLSAKTITRPDLVEWITGELDARDLPAPGLTLEVTETAECADLLEAVYLLRPLRQKGVRISIDDFGTGYTSLAVLPKLPLDELKVDQGFVIRSATSPADEAIVRSVRDLAGRLGLEAVAEGVEDAETAARLVAYGFDLLQGYHFARPMAESDLLAHVAGETGDEAWAEAQRARTSR